MRTYALSAAAYACALVLLCGCGSQVQTVAGQPAPGIPPPSPSPGPRATPFGALPDPSQLPRQTLSATINILDGNDFDSSLQANVSYATGQDAKFTPHFSPGAGSHTGLAYALYVFQPDALAERSLHLAWSDVPFAGRCFLGLANYDTDRWQWQLWDSSQPLVALADKNFNPDDGTVPLVVVLTGLETAQLAKLAIGANLPPVAKLSFDGPNDPAPVMFEATAQGSSDPDGVIVRYEYDKDGDGVYETTTKDGALPQSYLQMAEGVAYFGLRVTDDLGLTATTRLAYDTGFRRHWQTAKGGRGSFTNLALAPNGGYYAAGTDDSDVLLVRYDANGEIVWSYILDNPDGNDFARGMAPAPDGGVYLGARVTFYNNAIDTMPYARWLAHITPDGEIDWQYRWPDIDSGPHYRGVAAPSDGTAYVCGSLPSTGIFGEPVLLSFAPNGQLKWVRSWPTSGDQTASDIAVDTGGNAYLSFDQETGTPLVSRLLKFDAAGNTVGKLELTNPLGSITARALSADGDGLVTMLGSVSFTSGSPTAPFGQFVLRLDSNLNQNWAQWMPFNYGVLALTGGRQDADGTLWLCGQTNATSPLGGLLLRCDSSGADWHAYPYSVPTSAPMLWDIIPQAQTMFLCGAGPGDGGFSVLPLDPLAVQPLTLNYSNAVADAQPAAVTLEPTNLTLLAETPLPGDEGKAFSGKLYEALLDAVP
jgi:YD repeat-containing protein